MKRFLAGLIAGVLLFGLSGVSFAQKDNTAVVKPAQSVAGPLKGKIVSIDNAKNEVTIQDKGGMERIFIASAKQIASVKLGDEVKVALKSGNTAENIKVISKKHHNKS